MTDKRGMQSRRDRKLRRQIELLRENQGYTSEVLADNDEGKGKETED